MTLHEALDRASAAITRRDAEVLLLHVLRQEVRDRAWLRAHPEACLDREQQAVFAALVDRRAQCAPLQYLTGHQEFYGLDLQVTPDVLIPRPETELLVEAVLGWLRFPGAAPSPAPRIVDVGTGSGAIALALAAHLPTARITAVDVSSAALAVAERNARRLGLADHIEFLCADLLDSPGVTGSAEPFDVAVSNPPYIPRTEAPALEPQVRDFEPHTALFAGQDGLAVYRRLIPQASASLRPGGLLALEFGFGQQQALAQLLSGWHQLRFLDDLAGIPRVALAERPH